MPRYAVLDAPSILGLRPTGVERLPQSLRAAGLLASGQAVGLTVTILNPALDPGGVAAGGAGRPTAPWSPALP